MSARGSGGKVFTSEDIPRIMRRLCGDSGVTRIQITGLLGRGCLWLQRWVRNSASRLGVRAGHPEC